MSEFGIFVKPQLTDANSQVYEMIVAGTSPVLLATAKAYLGGSKNSDDTLVQTLINACTQWGQKFTKRDFSANQYTLLLDCFEDPIELRRNPIDVIDSVEYLKSGSFDTILATVYYLKFGIQVSSIKLNVDQQWPTDGDDREQFIKITFTTKAISVDKIDIATLGILRHVAYMYENRGDCGSCSECADAAGVKPTYNLIKIVNI